MDTEKVVRLLSRRRHDYANHLQVIKGYMELEMPERAMEYLDSAARELAQESRLFNSLPSAVSIPLYELQLWTQDRGASLRMGKLMIKDTADLVLSQGLTALYQVLEEVKAPDGEEEFEVWLDLVEDQGQTIIRLTWPGESGQFRREIVLTR